MGAKQVGRLEAADGSQASAGIPDNACSLVIHNPLAAPIYIVWGDGVPSSTIYDLAVPGVALMAFPLPDGLAQLNAIVVYPGAVPAADVGQHATLTVTANNQGTFVGPLA